MTNEIKSFKVPVQLNVAYEQGIISFQDCKIIKLGNKEYTIFNKPFDAIYENKESIYIVIGFRGLIHNTDKYPFVYVQPKNDISGAILVMSMGKLTIDVEAVLKSDISHLKYTEQSKLDFDGEKG